MSTNTPTLTVAPEKLDLNNIAHLSKIRRDITIEVYIIEKAIENCSEVLKIQLGNKQVLEVPIYQHYMTIENMIKCLANASLSDFTPNGAWLRNGAKNSLVKYLRKLVTDFFSLDIHSRVAQKPSLQHQIQYQLKRLDTVFGMSRAEIISLTKELSLG